MLSAGLGLIAGHTHVGPDRYVAAHTSRAATPNSPCSTLEQVGLGLDFGLPLVKTSARDRCDLDTVSVTGQALTAGFWTLQLAAWAAATLAIAGYTGLIRKA
jgi:hypothetical protein